ncbi:MAG: hypothetical protein M3N04_04540 [Actinomycetota bacterium]|nr:hypothetical protein [Actinomycetota bacterium]
MRPAADACDRALPRRRHEIPVPMVGMSPKVTVNGKPVLLAGINGVTSGVPPSPLIVAFPGGTKAIG